MNKIIGTFKNKDYYCPICGSNKIKGRSEQVCEDGCEMWFECGKCGWSGDWMNKVETVWGFQKEYIGNAYQSWQENVDKYKDEMENKFMENQQGTINEGRT